MIAAAVAQVVVGGNNVQTEVSGSPTSPSNNPLCQNHLIVNYQNDRRYSGSEVNNGVCENKLHKDRDKV